MCLRFKIGSYYWINFLYFLKKVKINALYCGRSNPGNVVTYAFHLTYFDPYDWRKQQQFEQLLPPPREQKHWKRGDREIYIEKG